ncbi:MAG: hypothetical protein JWM53_4194 [bacterium]|nr:hypothetical protein [bacterium]
MTARRALRSVAAVAALAAAVGCTKHQTEMILVITTEGVRIPDDVHKVHLTVADRTASLDDTVYDADVELCNPMLTTGCYDIPVTAVLFPGKSHAGDSVRVQVDAIGPKGKVIADAALFTFADQQSLRLDFVLYANCLGNVTCADRDQACGPLDQCIDLHPGQTNGALDIALPVAADLSIPQSPPDLTPVDLANADLTLVPPDLVSILDLAGCAGVTCDMGEQCVAGACQPCGFAGQPCCFGPTAPPPNRPNAGGTPGSGMCLSTNLECNGATCENCGGDGQLCCSQQVPDCNGNDVCMAGRCQMPPPLDMSMPGSMDMMIMFGDMTMIGGSIDLF